MSIEFDVARWMQDDARRSKGGTEPFVSKPSLLNFYSKAKDGTPIQSSRDAIRIYRPPPSLPVDLDKSAYNGSEEEESPNAPVEWVHVAALSSPPQHSGQIFTFRNNLNKLLGTTINLRNEWAIDGCWKDNALYLDIVKLPLKTFPGSGLFNYFGRKFEQVVTEPLTEEGQMGPGAECCLIVSFGLGCHWVVMGAEVDCLAERGAQNLEPESFLELKSAKYNAANLARNQYPKWWLQSFLVGIPKIVCGLRDDEKGFIREIRELQVRDLPSMARLEGAPFDASQAIRFGEAALSWMKRVTSDKQGTIRFSFDPHKRVINTSQVTEMG